LSVR